MNERAPRLLVVDDGDRHIELAHALLRDYDYITRCELPGPCWQCAHRPGCTLTHAHDWAETEQALVRHPDVDAVLLDVAFDLPVERLLPLPDEDEASSSEGDGLERRRRLQGLSILHRLRRTRGALPVVLMTSREELRLEHAEGALVADELVTLAGESAFDARALGLLVERVLARTREAGEAGGFRWGRSQPMARLRRDAETLARTSLPMLLLGETGTGKSALAERVIHAASGRDGPFVAADLSAIPETLVAAEMFGTVRGAFSGAVDRPGLFQRAHGGTLLLDEIGNLPLDVQRMLLLTLQDRRVTRLGDGAMRPVDVKLVAATNTDLGAAVAAGTFRANLYARLNPSAALRLPPLRDHIEDLEPLMGAFVRRTFAAGPDRGLLVDYLARAGLDGAPRADLSVGRATAQGEGVVFVLPRGTLGTLRAHRWPGNVRELELLVASASIFALADALHAAEKGRSTRAATARTVPIPARLVRELLDGGGATPVGSQTRARGASGATVPLAVHRSARLQDVARDLERALLERLFEETSGDFAAMAKRLLTGDADTNARRVRLRFNQLGLRVRGRGQGKK